MRRKSWTNYFVAASWVLAMSFGSSSVLGQEPAEKETLGKAALTAYVANIESFTFYKCRYRITDAEAQTVEAAIRGDYVNASFYDNRLLVDGDRDLYEGFAPPPDAKQAKPMPGKKGVSIVTSTGFSNRYLADGKREMNYNPTLRAVNLFSIESRVHDVEFTPLGMGYLGHRNRRGPNVRMKQTERLAFSVDGFEEVLGHPVVTVRLTDKEIFRPPSKPPIEFAYTYSFDPSRGHLPIRMQLLGNGKPKAQVFVTHMRECSNQRWFPERSVDVFTPDKPGALYKVREIKLLELDADHRPDKSEFFINVPAGTQVLEAMEDRHFFYLKQDEKLTIDDIPKLFEMCQKVGNTPLMDTAVPHSSAATWIRWSVGLAGLILAFGGAFVLLRRIRLKRMPA